MGVKIKSARGETVDFDLLKIKEAIASNPPTTEVKARQDFIDKRLRRRIKKVAPVVAVEETLPGTEEINEEPKMIDEVVEPPKSRTKQKSRPTKKADKE